jgi:uncharacterized membrane protein
MRYDDDRIERLERLVDELSERVARLEGTPAPAPEPQPQAAPPPSWQREDWEEPAAPQPRDTYRPPTPSLPSIDLEDLLGRRVLGWVGAIAVLIGVVLFLAMAAQRGWIDETTRIVLAYFGSTALLAAGLYLYERQGRTQAALAAVATAIAALYASTTAATTHYGLVEPAVGLGIAGLVGAAATAIAVRWSSPIVAAVGIIGAVLSPVLVDAGTTDVSLAFMAVALVAATGVLLWQRWNWLAAAVFVTSVPQLVGWMIDAHDESLVLTLVVLALFWAVYVVAAIGYELRVPTERLRLASASLLLADAILLAGAGWLTLEEEGHGDAGTVWVIGAALAHVTIGVATLRGRISREVALLALAVGIGLSAIGAALALDGPALVAAWSVEAVLLTWLARRTGEARGYLAAAGFLTAAAAHTLVFDAPPDKLFDEASSTAIVAVVLVTGAAVLASRLYAGPWQGATVLPDAIAAAGLAYLSPVALEGVLVVAGWVAVGVALAALRDRAGVLADLAPVYVGLAAAHALAIEAPPIGLREGVDDLAVAALAIALPAAAAIAIARLRDWRPDVRRALEVVLAAGAVYLPSIAIVDLTTTGESFEPGQTPQVLLSAFWGLTGLAALVFGLVRDDRTLRLGGLGLLGLAVAKVYVYDLAELDEIYRVLSFIALGLLLLAGAFAYQRMRRGVGAAE